MFVVARMRMDYDLVVVGAGPGGSIAAKTAAERGLNVLLIDRRQELGVPVRCGEIVNKNGIENFTEIDKKWVAAEVKWAKIHLPDGKEILQDAEKANELLIVLERKIFDRYLVKLAARAGADILVKTTATDIRREDNQVLISITRMGEKLNIKSKVVIGADGIESRVGKWMGIDTTLELDEIGSGAQYLITDINFNPDGSYFWYGKDIAPGGYAWLFPKGEKRANVGVGVIPSLASKCAKEYLDDFVRSKFGNGKIIEFVAGAYPLKGPIKTAVADNVMLVGDAARHTDPFTGGGIINAMKGGYLAGCVAEEAIKKGDFSSQTLKKYDELWKSDFGQMLQENRIRLEELLQIIT